MGAEHVRAPDLCEMIPTGAAGGATSLRSGSRSSCSPTVRARRSRWRAAATFHFLAATPHEALDEALEAAGGTDVRIGGGPTVVREFLKAGLVDRLHVAIVPILLGRGIRLWDDLRGVEDGYRVTSEVASSGIMHLTFSR